MTIEVGDKVPGTSLLQLGENGPEPVDLGEKLAGRKVIIFALPGPYTATCTAAHVPSFIRTATALADAGVDEIICIAVSDPWVMAAWGEVTGATKAGLTMLADSASEYTKAVGLAFTAPASGFYDRTVRHAIYAVDGVVRVLHLEEARGVCETTSGEAMLSAVTHLD